MEEVWKIVGPTVERHLSAVPLWKIFCAVYYEGLAHAVGAMVKRDSDA